LLLQPPSFEDESKLKSWLFEVGIKKAYCLRFW
jgi:hypothetical protein